MFWVLCVRFPSIFSSYYLTEQSQPSSLRLSVISLDVLFGCILTEIMQLLNFVLKTRLKRVYLLIVQKSNVLQILVLVIEVSKLWGLLRFFKSQPVNYGRQIREEEKQAFDIFRFSADDIFWASI